MYSICIKFKPESNWRPNFRQFESLQGAYNAICEAFDKWPVHHASLFNNGVFERCYWRNPEETAAARNAARQRSAAQIRFGYF